MSFRDSFFQTLVRDPLEGETGLGLVHLASVSQPVDWEPKVSCKASASGLWASPP